MKSAQTSSMFTSLTETEEASLCGGIGIISITKGTIKKGTTGKKGASGKKVSSVSVKKVATVKSTKPTTTIASTSVVSLLLESLFS